MLNTSKMAVVTTGRCTRTLHEIEIPAAPELPPATTTVELKRKLDDWLPGKLDGFCDADLTSIELSDYWVVKVKPEQTLSPHLGHRKPYTRRQIHARFRPHSEFTGRRPRQQLGNSESIWSQRRKRYATNDQFSNLTMKSLPSSSPEIYAVWVYIRVAAEHSGRIGTGFQSPAGQTLNIRGGSAVDCECVTRGPGPDYCYAADDQPDTHPWKRWAGVRLWPPWGSSSWSCWRWASA